MNREPGQWRLQLVGGDREELVAHVQRGLGRLAGRPLRRQGLPQTLLRLPPVRDLGFQPQRLLLQGGDGPALVAPRRSARCSSRPGRRAYGRGTPRRRRRPARRPAEAVHRVAAEERERLRPPQIVPQRFQADGVVGLAVDDEQADHLPEDAHAAPAGRRLRVRSSRSPRRSARGPPSRRRSSRQRRRRVERHVPAGGARRPDVNPGRPEPLLETSRCASVAARRPRHPGAEGAPMNVCTVSRRTAPSRRTGRRAR